MTDKGARLRELRLLRGMTQGEFAAALSIKQPYLSAIERGLKPADMAASRASWVFNIDGKFFEEEPSPYRSGSLNFRTNKLSAKEQEAVRVTFTELERAARRAVSHIPVESVAVDGLKDRAGSLGPDVIEDIAQEIRRCLGLAPTGPVFNVTSAIESIGVPIVDLINPYVELSSKIDGVSSPDTSEDRAVVAVTECLDGGRVRFTRAHELGHLVLHTLVRPGSEAVREDEAHLFAGAFLMPAADAYELITPHLTLEGYARIKADYAISIAALIRRARELRIIDKDRYRSLYIQLSSRGWRREEPVKVPVEKPHLLINLRLDALDEAVVNAPTEPDQKADVINLFGG